MESVVVTKNIATTTNRDVAVIAIDATPIANASHFVDDKVLQFATNCPRTFRCAMSTASPLVIPDGPVVLSHVMRRSGIAPSAEDLVATRACDLAPIIDAVPMRPIELRCEFGPWRCATLSTRRAHISPVACSCLPSFLPIVATLADREAIRRFTTGLKTHVRRTADGMSGQCGRDHHEEEKARTQGCHLLHWLWIVCSSRPGVLTLLRL